MLWEGVHINEIMVSAVDEEYMGKGLTMAVR